METHPDIAELARQAMSCFESGNLTEAYRHCSKICEIENGNPNAWVMLGRIYTKAGDPVQAEYCFRRAVTLDPSNADAYNRLAGVLLALNRLGEAEKICRYALGIDPANAEIYANLGNVLCTQGRQREAAASYRQALKVDPGFIGAYLNLGNTLKSMKEYLQAAAVYRRILEINHRYIDIYNLVGECYLEAGLLEKSLDFYREAIRLQPGYVQAHMNMGFVLGAMKNYPGAIDCYRRALELEPGRADIYLSRGLVEKRLGDFAAAEFSYRQALALNPGNLDTQLALSLVELTRGDFSAGWELYAARKSVRQRRFDAPVPLDDDLSGCRILVTKDQGIGDEIFFLRFVRQLKARGPWIAYRTDPKIKSLVARLPFLDEVVDDDDQVPECDLRLSAGDLPMCLGFGDDTPIPQPVELSPLQSSITKVRKQLDNIGPGPYMGVTWWAGTKQQGSFRDDQLAYREAPIELIAKSLQPLRSTVLVLQRDPAAADMSLLSGLLGRPVHNLSRFNHDLEGMLALLSLLNEYIGVDNTNMHLAAVIGKSCRILVPHPPEWRVMSTGSESPWFPGFSLYRQCANGDWSGAFSQLAADLVAGA